MRAQTTSAHARPVLLASVLGLAMTLPACGEPPVVLIDGPAVDGGSPAPGGGAGNSPATDPPSTPSSPVDAAAPVPTPADGGEEMGNEEQEGECTVDADCSPDEPRCDTATGECVDCMIDADCNDDSSPFCSPERDCVECRSDTDCDDLEDPRCQPTTGECVECVVDGDCDLDDPVCRLDDGQCAECDPARGSCDSP